MDHPERPLSCRFRCRFPVWALLLLFGFASADCVAGPRQAVVRQLAGTHWSGTSVDGPWSCDFRADGTIHYIVHSDEYTDGVWKVKGAHIHMEFNNRYAEYDGTITGSKMKGDGANIAGRSWKWDLEKKKENK